PKAVHFHKQLVQCLLPFVMTTAETGTTLAADSVNFINKDNTWRVFLRIFKQVTHTGSTDTDKHLNKVRSADREKWRTGLTGNRAGKKCLTRSRGSDKQHAFRNEGTQTGKFAGVFQKLDHFHKFLLLFISPGHIFKSNLFLIILTIHLCLALAKVHDTATAAALSLAKNKEENQSDNQKRNHSRKQCDKSAWLFFFLNMKYALR